MNLGRLYLVILWCLMIFLCNVGNFEVELLYSESFCFNEMFLEPFLPFAFKVIVCVLNPISCFNES